MNDAIGRSPRGGHPRALALAVALTVALGLGGCGGDDETDAGPGPSASVVANELIAEASGPSPTANPHAKRSRVVKLNTGVLPTVPAEPADVHLQLFEDRDYTATLTFADSDGIEQWTGTLQGVEHSNVTIVRVADIYRLQVTSPEGTFEAGPDLTGRYVVSELDPDSFPGETQPSPPPSD